MMKRRIAIIDDDPFVVAHLKSTLEQSLPDVEILGVVEPVAPAGFDVYIVDQDFYGKNCGQDVVQRIRSISPKSLVLAYSAHLDREFLRALLREGCEGAFDKGSLEELGNMVEIIEAHFSHRHGQDLAVKGLGNTVRAISGLMHEWNLRLTDSGRANAETARDA